MRRLLVNVNGRGGRRSRGIQVLRVRVVLFASHTSVFGAILDLADLATECFALLAGAAGEEVKLMIASGLFPAIFEGTEGI